MRRGCLPAHEARHLSVTGLALGHLGAEGIKDTRSLRLEAERERGRGHSGAEPAPLNKPALRKRKGPKEDRGSFRQFAFCS